MDKNTSKGRHPPSVALRVEAPPDSANFSFETVNIPAAVHSKNSATPDELVAMANAIFAEVKASGISVEDEAGTDRLLQDLQKKYKDFLDSFPLVLRWMVQLRQYSPSAFRTYLSVYAAAMGDGIRTRHDYNVLQAKYLVLLERKLNPKQDNVALQTYRQKIVDMLDKEAEEFEKIQQEAAREIEIANAAEDRERRELLYTMILRQKLNEADGRSGANGKADGGQ
jgi:hypothetical protein